MKKSYKLVVTGPFNVGKTTFVSTLSDISVVSTDKQTTWPAESKLKPTTTVALDYGNVNLNKNCRIHLFGTPGQDRFDFMRELLTDGMDGFIFLIDSTDQQGLNKANSMLALFQQHKKAPYLLVANKADCRGLSGDEIRKRLKLAPDQPLMSCVATDKTSVRAVVERLIDLIESGAMYG